MRPKWIVGILVGIIFLYVGFNGLVIPFSFALVGDVINEPWTTFDMTKWYGVSYPPGSPPSISPAGQLLMTATSGYRNKVFRQAAAIPAIPETFTVEIRFQIDAWVTGNEFYIEVYSQAYGQSHILSWTPTAIALVGSGQPNVPVTMDTAWHVWTLTVNQTGSGKVVVYRDAVQVAQFAATYHIATGSRVSFNLATMSDVGASVHIDYYLMDQGIKIPSPPLPTQGYLRVRTTYSLDGVIILPCAVQVTIKKNGVFWQTWTTDSQGTAGPTLVDVATYNVSGTYNSVSKFQVVTVADSSTVTADLFFYQAPSLQYGSLQVRGYYNGQPVSFEAWYVYQSTPSPHVTAPSTGYTWNNVAVGTYDVYGTYQTVSKNKQTSVIANTLSVVDLDFGTAPPTEARVVLHTTLWDGVAYRLAANVAVTVKQGTIIIATWTTNASGIYTGSLTTGTYVFAGTYQGLNANQTLIISDLIAKDVTLTFIQSGTPPPPTDWLAWLLGLVDDPLMRDGMKLVGGLLTLVSVIMFVIPRKKQSPTFMPVWPSY